MKGFSNTSLTRVKVQDREGVWQELINKIAVESSLIEENYRRFNQTKMIPLVNLPIRRDIGPCGCGSLSDQIFEGSYDPQEFLAHPTKNYLQALYLPTTVPSIDIEKEFSWDQFKEGWRKAKEKTSSGPSGIHFGNYKAGIHSNLVGKIMWQMKKIPITKGFSPERWRQGVDVCILKKQRDFRVNKTRIIVLYEEDFNFANKWVGRRMIAEGKTWDLSQGNNMVVENTYRQTTKH